MTPKGNWTAAAPPSEKTKPTGCLGHSQEPAIHLRMRVKGEEQEVWVHWILATAAVMWTYFKTRGS